MACTRWTQLRIDLIIRQVSTVQKPIKLWVKQEQITHLPQACVGGWMPDRLYRSVAVFSECSENKALSLQFSLVTATVAAPTNPMLFEIHDARLAPWQLISPSGTDLSIGRAEKSVQMSFLVLTPQQSGSYITPQAGCYQHRIQVQPNPMYTNKLTLRSCGNIYMQVFTHMVICWC